MRVVDRTVLLLNALSAAESGLGVSRLAETIGAPPATVHRLLTVLVRNHLAVQDPESKRYRLGPAVLALSESYQRHNNLIVIARQHLNDLESRIEESVFLTQLIGSDAICVATAQSARPWRFSVGVGERMPYTSAASARAILAFRDRQEIVRLIEAEPISPMTYATPTTRSEILNQLEKTRLLGYAVQDEEVQLGVAAIAAPVHSGSGDVTASVAIIAPRERLVGDRQSPAIDQLLNTAAAIARELGYSVASAPGEAPPDPFGPGRDGRRVAAAVPLSRR